MEAFILKNILIIDDSALMRRIISDIINSDEELHNERFAVNGLEGITLLESGFRFDCIILDINMPKMNVFPKEMLKDPGKAICMFVKKDEIRKC